MKHDEFVRFAMIDPVLYTAFFRHFLGDLEKDIDFTRLKPEPGTFVSSALNKTITDLQFQVPWQEQDDVFVSILLEHKSAGSVRGGSSCLAFQLRVQEVALLQRFARQHPGQKLPIVLLVGLYHGPRPYSGPLKVADIMAGPPNLMPPRWNNQDMLLIDLCQIEEQALGKGKLALFLGVLKIIYDADFVDKYKQMLPKLQEYTAEHEDTEFLIALNHYLLSNARWESLPEFREVAIKSYSEEVGGAIMTIAELLKKEGQDQARKEGRLEGRKEGRIEGRVEGRAEVAMTMLSKGLDWETITDFTGLTHDELALIASKAS